jgi:hypothetical protein
LKSSFEEIMLSMIPLRGPVKKESFGIDPSHEVIQNKTMNVEQITLSLPAVLAAGFAVMVCFAGITSWIHATFERKIDTHTRHREFDRRLDQQDSMLRNVAEDVSYIRGRMEK